jgi:hypothetical protein
MDGLGFLDHEEGTQNGLHASQCNSNKVHVSNHPYILNEVTLIKQQRKALHNSSEVKDLDNSISKYGLIPLLPINLINRFTTIPNLFHIRNKQISSFIKVPLNPTTRMRGNNNSGVGKERVIVG